MINLMTTMLPQPDADVTTAMVAIRGLKKSYWLGRREVIALRGVDLYVAPGEFVAIMGASGSGKSTLLHLCGGLDAPDAGSIVVAGNDLTSMSERALTTYRRQTVGIVFQQFNLMPALDVRENILLPAQLAGTCDAIVQRRLQELLDILGLAHRADHRPEALSGGEQQRVAIARALIMEPKILLADEPTGNLDSVNAAAFWKLLRRVIASINITLMVVTHEPSAAAEAQRVVVLRDGTNAGEFGVEVGDDARVLADRYQTMAT